MQKPWFDLQNKIGPRERMRVSRRREIQNKGMQVNDQTFSSRKVTDKYEVKMI